MKNYWIEKREKKNRASFEWFKEILRATHTGASLEIDWDGIEKAIEAGIGPKEKIELPIPEVPALPDIDLGNLQVPPPDFNLPPMVFSIPEIPPGPTYSPLDIDINSVPSEIKVTCPSMPTIKIEPPTFPKIEIPSIIGGKVDIPSIINIDWPSEPPKIQCVVYVCCPGTTPAEFDAFVAKCEAERLNKTVT